MPLDGYFFFFFIELAVIAGQIIPVQHCYTEPYYGEMNHLPDGTQCLNWKTVNSPYVPYHENHNYCRNPNNFKSPWCYTNKNSYAYAFCDIKICEIDCYTGIGASYIGTINITVDGIACQRWDSQSPHQHEASHNPKDTNNNYCRNADKSEKPWCYTTTTSTRFQYCRIPKCEIKQPITCPKPVSSSSVIVYPESTPYYLGTTVRLSCNFGYTGENVTSTCQANTSWSPQPPKCLPIECPNLILPLTVTVHPRSTSYYFGTTVRLSCNFGYTGENLTSTCRADSSWSSQPPKCKLIECPNPILPSTVTVHPRSTPYYFGTTVRLSCNFGYIGENLTSTCRADSSWSSQPPKCKLVTCPSQKETPGILIEPKKESYNITEIIKMSCKSGYNGLTVTANCSGYGNWTNPLPQCSPVPCPTLNATDFMENMNLTGYHYLDNVIFRCEKGYNISNPSLLTCQANENQSTGQWSNNQPICKPLPCPSLKIPEHSNHSKDEKSNIFTTGQKIYFGCVKGYYLNGNNGIECKARNGRTVPEWNLQPPVCHAVPCIYPNVTDNLKWDPNNTEYRFLDTITFSCSDDLLLVNSFNNVWKCDADETNLKRGKWKGEIPACQAKETLDQSSDNVGAIGGGVGAVVFVMVLVIIMIVIILKRRTNAPKMKEEVSHKELDNSHIYSDIQKRVSEIETRTTKNITNNVYYNEASGEQDNGGYYAFSVGSQLPKGAIEFKDFYNYVEMGRGKEGEIEKQFLNLKSGLQKSTEAALKPQNRLKNKYKDMYAYDETRVTLDNSKALSNSDYINASFIQGYDQVRKYIASQGPLDKTVEDFWRMVWQYDCGKIVMLTNVFENGKQKCIQYWPDSEQKKKSFGLISLLLIKEDVYSDFTVRRLKLQKGSETKVVLQFHFTAWPDKDVPKYASSLVHFLYKVNTTRTTAKGPMVVHCSAGVGRTGTYIALDYIVNEAKERDYVEVFRTVEILRNQRVNMVQTAHQYMFLHESVLEALMCPNAGIPSRDFPDHYKDLMRFDNAKKKHKLQVEYEIMNSISSRHDEKVFSKGKSDENKHKNRYSNIIPVESEMPLLSTVVGGHNEYINAVFLPGYRSNKTFIVTQMPLETTVVDLWRLVYDYDIPTIVMLNKEVKRGISSNVYWPQTNESVSFGPFCITCANICTLELYTCFNLTVRYKTQEERKVKLFQSMFWDDNAVIPGSANEMLKCLSAVEDGHLNRATGPVLVHCLNGCDKSGLYCVLATVIERLRIEQDVDIQHIIKQMRNRRPQIIPNYEQFQFIYEAVLEYLKEFETYSNFQ